MSKKKLVGYYRVIRHRVTGRWKTGETADDAKRVQHGYGKKEQLETLEEHARQVKGNLVATFCELESQGKAKTREEFDKALARAEGIGATLVIARVGRLAMNAPFIAKLMQSSVKFVCLDNPDVVRENLHKLAAEAEERSVEMSERVRRAHSVVRKSGGKLGSAREGHWDGRENKRGWKQAAKVSTTTRQQQTETFYSTIYPEIVAIKEAVEQERQEEQESLGRTGDHRGGHEPIYCPIYETVADRLNERGLTNQMGRPFNAPTVWRIMKRLEGKRKVKAK